MSSLSKDLNISNNQSPAKKVDLNVSPTKETKKEESLTPSRKQMISEIKDYKDSLSDKSNFKRGSAYNMTNLFLKLSNLNFTIANIRTLSDEELLAIWSDIKSSK